MSTILKSLKRLEKDKEQAIAGLDRPLQTPLGVSQHDMQRAVQMTWLRAGIFRWGIVAAIAMGAAAGIYTYARQNAPQQHPVSTLGHQAPDQSSPASIPATKRQKPQRTTDRSPRSTRQASSAPASATGRSHLPVAAQKPALPRVAQNRLQTGRSVRPPIPPPESLPRPAAIGKPLHRGELAELKEFGISPTIQPEVAIGSRSAGIPTMPRSTATKRRGSATETSGMDNLPPPRITKTEPERYANAERLTDGRLKVQAIVWSETPEDRMAVVNNRTVREGGTIEGFSVVGIGEEDIYVRESGSQVLKVSFGGP